MELNEVQTWHVFTDPTKNRRHILGDGTRSLCGRATAKQATSEVNSQFIESCNHFCKKCESVSRQ